MALAGFRVALSADFRLPDGSPAYPDVDLGPLHADPGIEVAYVAPVGGVMRGADLAGFDALILLVPRFDQRSVPADGRLALVARFGVGFDSVDVPTCTANAIAVSVTPDGVRRPVAVAILTFMLALTGRLQAKDRLVRQGPDGWAQRSRQMGTGLVGRTLGQLGIGNIGAEVFRLARPLDMRFIAHDPYADTAVAAELGIELVSIEELFAQSDVLSVSVPLTDETRHIVDARLLGLMKPTAYLINTARGPVIDQSALHDTLSAGRIAGAGLDVFEDEPTPLGEPITRLDNVLLAPHALCWTDQCFAGIGASAIGSVLEVKAGRAPVRLVDPEVARAPAFQAKLGLRA